MSARNKASVFISSTCYDLGQVRFDLKDFIENMGYEALMSENSGFPIDPNQDNIKNCLDVIKKHTDIFILIIGGRYGSKSESGKSITNLEFEEANLVGIPKYVFINKEILNVLKVWKANPDGDFSSVVDTNKLFEFIDELYGMKDIWVIPFEKAQDIILALKKQLSYLLLEGLNCRKLIKPVNKELLGLSPESLKIFVEKQDNWPLYLFAQLLVDNVIKFKDKRNDIRYQFCSDNMVTIKDGRKLLEWVLHYLNQQKLLMQNIDKPFNEGCKRAIEKLALTGDLSEIVYLTSRIGLSYEKLLDANLSCLGIQDDESKELQGLLIKNSMSIINDFEDFVFGLSDKISRYIKETPDERLNIVLKFNSCNTDFSGELKKLEARIFKEFDV